MAHIKAIISDKWFGRKVENEEMPCQSVDEALEALRRLNGKDRTQVLFQGADKALMIGGGNEGRYSVVIVVGEDERFYTLTDATNEGHGDVTIVTGGQAGSFPANQCIGLEDSLKAVRDFDRHGEPSPDLKWMVE